MNQGAQREDIQVFYKEMFKFNIFLVYQDSFSLSFIIEKEILIDYTESLVLLLVMHLTTTPFKNTTYRTKRHPGRPCHPQTKPKLHVNTNISQRKSQQIIQLLHYATRPHGDVMAERIERSVCNCGEYRF